MRELAGALRERVELQRRGEERDALGGASGAWVSLGLIWAAVVPERLGTAVAGDATDARPLWRVTMRARNDVVVGDRLLWGGRVLMLRGMESDPRLPDRIILRAEEMR